MIKDNHNCKRCNCEKQKKSKLWKIIILIIIKYIFYIIIINK